VLTDEDIARCAKAMIRQYGADAAPRAHRHAEASRHNGNYEVHAIWTEVAAVVERLQAEGWRAEEAAGDDPVHLRSWRRRRF